LRPKIVLAGILIALGVVALVAQGVSYTTRGKTVDLGPLQVTTEKTHDIPLSPVLGAIALVGGVAILIMDRRGFGPAA
jgi:hypothetical protein